MSCCKAGLQSLVTSAVFQARIAMHRSLCERSSPQKTPQARQLLRRSGGEKALHICNLSIL